jgi:hypothetical protein
MLRAGLLSEGQVESAHGLSEERGIRFVDALLDLELADEDAIVAFSHSKLMIPRVREAVLKRVGPAALERLSAELAWRHDALPVAVDELGNLTVAMSDPTDVRAVNEIAVHSRAYLVRAVAPVRALRDAIAQYYGQRVSGGDASPSMGGNGRAGEETPLPEGKIHSPLQTSKPASWNPPMLDSSQEPVPLSSEALARIHAQLVTATESDDVTRLLLDYLGAGFDRVIMFVHSREELRGRDCRGRDLLPEAVRQVRIPSAGPSVFSKCIEQQRPHFGPMPSESAIDKMFSEALGGLRGNVLVLPLKLGTKVPLLVFASGSRTPVDPRSINELCDAVGVALTRILAMRRNR